MVLDNNPTVRQSLAQGLLLFIGMEIRAQAPRYEQQK